MNRLSIAELRSAYLNNETTPEEVIDACVSKIAADESSNAWISTLSGDQLAVYLEALKSKPIESTPLWGIPFAIKDNIDLIDCKTTAGCPDYAFQPEASAFVVKLLIEAGAIPLGKTNMDQFATGLVGTRSPYGAVPCIYDSDYVSGGSSSGSAYAVASGQAAFSLGTDTAGSGRVPAAFNGLVGVKPTRGVLSCSGVVPACKSLDCVSIFTNDLTDAKTVLAVAAIFDSEDIYSRPAAFKIDSKSSFKLGVPKAEQQYFLNDEYQQLFTAFCEQAKASGAELIEIDFTPFSEAAKLLYQGPWVAERFHAVGDFVEHNLDKVDESVATIIRGAESVTGKKAFSGFYHLQAQRRLAQNELDKVDCILTPTTCHQFTHEDIANSPILNNTELGFYTNFMNLLDYAALSFPAGSTSNGLGFGVTLFANAQSDVMLQQIASSIIKADYQPCDIPVQESYIPVAVCGAHLEGMSLNWQLSDRKAVLREATTTSSNYRFYALEGGPPFRPGLARVAEKGAAIEVEVWHVPSEHFGSFVAGIPAPLGIGKLELADGSWVPGFICEPEGLESAEDITKFGGWRAYMASKN